MRRFPLPSLVVLLLSGIFFSCHKDHSSSGTAGQSASIPIDLSYTDQSNQLQTFELIISEPTGAVLLDTIAPVNTYISATLSTHASLVNVTTVILQPRLNAYTAWTVTGVNPKAWQAPCPQPYNVYAEDTASVSATIQYINAPSLPLISFRNGFFTDGPGYFLPIGSSSSASFSYGFAQIGHNPTYLFFPGNPGLYKWHTMQTTSDVVDLSQMDTAASINFARPSAYPYFNCLALTGYADTTNFSDATYLYGFSGQNGLAPYAADVEYPSTPMQRYEAKYILSDSNDNQVTLYNYSSRIPAALPALPDQSSYTLTSNSLHQFSLNWNSVHPSYYSTSWATGNLNWTIYSSPDSTTLHPGNLFSSLGSQLLKGQDLSSLSLTSFSFETAQGLDYAGFFNYTCNPTLLKTQRLPGSVIYSKSF